MKKKLLTILLFLLVLFLSGCAYGREDKVSHNDFVKFYEDSGLKSEKSRALALGDSLNISSVEVDEDGDAVQSSFDISLASNSIWATGVDGGGMSFTESVIKYDSDNYVVGKTEREGKLSSISNTTISYYDEDEDGEADYSEKNDVTTESISYSRNLVTGDDSDYTKLDSYRETMSKNVDKFYEDSMSNTPDEVKTVWSRTVSSHTYDIEKTDGKISYTDVRENLTFTYTKEEKASTSYKLYYEKTVTTSVTSETLDGNGNVIAGARIVVKVTEKTDARQSMDVMGSKIVVTSIYTLNGNRYEKDGEDTTVEEETAPYQVSDEMLNEYSAQKFYQKFIALDELNDALSDLSALYQGCYLKLENHLYNADEKKEEIIKADDVYYYRYKDSEDSLVQFRFLKAGEKAILDEIIVFKHNGTDLEETRNKISIIY